MSDFLGTGIVSPLRRENSDFASASGFEVVKSAVREVLGTVGDSPLGPGELPWDTQRGSRLQSLRHQNNDEELAEYARIYVAEALARQELRVEVTDVETDQDHKNNRLHLRVFVRAITENVPGNQVLLPGEPVEVLI